jgi:formylglycine-generating enzyme required for sulfatase activity
MADIFLSYASADRERIRPLVKILEQQGWSIWWDRKIPPGKTYDQVIEKALDEARCVVVVWSQHSVVSDWVKVEAEEGMNRKILVPVLIEEARIPLGFRRIQAARLVDWQGETSHHELESLFGAIESILGETESVRNTLHQTGQIYAVPSALYKPAKTSTSHRPKVEEVTAPWFEFDVVTVDEQGDVTERRKERARYFIEDLGNNVKLEMVEIPGGTFTMGSPKDEAMRSDSEGPQHRVTVNPFLMSRYQITREQWREIAREKSLKIERDLDADPSYFQDDWRQPVEYVSWNDALEFCKRLEEKTGKSYRLPSEAEWEYAARAGTTTPFAFGPTITPEIVNYNGTHPYLSAPKGLSRNGTVPVGSLRVANAFGLFDMHGNVWEWCEDVWHGNYDGAPDDGRAWLTGVDLDRRVLRGGSWFDDGDNCRSAGRDSYRPVYRNNRIGFRVVVAARTR